MTTISTLRIDDLIRVSLEDDGIVIANGAHRVKLSPADSSAVIQAVQELLLDEAFARGRKAEQVASSIRTRLTQEPS